MVMALLPKKYLRIYDVAEYLNNLNTGYQYDIHDSFDRNKLSDDIYDLIVHGELKAVFKAWTDDFQDAYFIVHNSQLDQILRFNSSARILGHYLIYCYADGTKPKTRIEGNIIDDDSINFDNIYIPIKELDALFSPKVVSNHSKAPPPPNHIKASAPFQRTIGDVIKAEKQKEPISPNRYQIMTMLYDYFTPHQACCFIAGLHPNFNGADDELEMGESIVEGGLKSGKLVADDDGQIKGDDLKLFLHSKDWIMKGFNDNMSNNTDKIPAPTVTQTQPPNNDQLIKELAAAKAQIADLESDLKQAQADNDQLRLQAGTPADKQLKNQDSKIVVYLAFVLAQKIPKYRKSNLNINAQQVGEAITIMAQELGLDKDDMHGFKRPDARLRTLINDNKELLNHFENLIKDNEKN